MITCTCEHCGKAYQELQPRGLLQRFCSPTCLLKSAIAKLEADKARLEDQLRIERDRANALRHELAVSYRRVDELETARSVSRDWLDPKPGEF